MINVLKKAKVKATGEIIEVFFSGGRVWINKADVFDLYEPEEIDFLNNNKTENDV